MEKQPFNIGDHVWWASATAYSESFVPCPICAGKATLGVILGDGTIETIDCSYCEHNPGRVRTYTEKSDVHNGVVTGVQLRYDDKWEIHVGSWMPNINDVFFTKEEAEARAAVLLVGAKQQALQNFESQFRPRNKKSGWTVGYHRAQIKDLERSLEWHRNKLHLLKEKS